ncbi:MAG: gliding motility-associated C-terminal domain-containing protein [Bacteroidia bacterium]
MLLTISNSYCEDTALRTLEVTEQYSFYIPNSFTPNTDGKNDLFEAYGTNITSANIAVFNRWGMKVFESSVMPFSWNGKKMNSGEDLPQGIYVYTVKLTDKTGHSHSYNGTVALIR